jgi:DNA-binding NarL/FixJ family response regulator
MVRKRVGVVEDQLFTRQLTIEDLRAHYGPAVEVDGFATVEDLLNCGPSSFDVVVLDLHLRLGKLEGARAIEAIRAEAPDARVLVLSGLASREAVEQARLAGASGFVCKDTAEPGSLPAGIEAAISGDWYVDPGLLERIGAAERKVLSARQREVLRLEALGCKLRQIARELDPPLTEAGVRRHIERIVEIYPEYGKQADRVRLAIDLGLVSPWEVHPRPGGPVR